MCSKNSPCTLKKAPKKTPPPPKPATKSRTKTRKPKFLSLRNQLSTHKKKMSHKQELINLFPLRSENLVQEQHQDASLLQDQDDHVSDHVTFLFQTHTHTSISLHGILDSTTTTTTTTASDEATYSYSEDKYLKTAMKCSERDASEERWVTYWEVVEKKEQEEVSSCCCNGGADPLDKMVQTHGDKKRKGLLMGLKLDYQHILNAWSDKGPLFIRAQSHSPQTVPDLHDAAASDALMDGIVENLWSVPDMEGSRKMGQREASVLRYKQKKQSRLFSKRIRYEVRKLNAEKRPRLKGRFVKRNGEE